MNKTEFLTRFHHPRQILPEADFPLGKPGRPAAVLLPIVAREGELTMLFTQRASHLRHHAGQVSFPGGKQESFDKDLLATALRETQEEIGLAEDNIEIIGSLPMFRTVSKFEVVPFVSIVKPPFELTLDANEVAEVFEVPLVYLLDQQNHLIHWIKRKNYKHPIYFIPWEDKNIWGATASFVRHLSNHVADN